MRMSSEEKERSHGRIVASASRLLRQRGLDGASVADVMSDAGMTHGGFYKHFDSKDALVEAALDDAFESFVSRLSAADADEALRAYRRLYLSDEHRADAGVGCPIAALGAQVGRASTSVKDAFGRGVRRMVDVLSRSFKGSATKRRTDALRELSMLVGAMVIARASDDELSREVLAACGSGASHAA